MEAILELKRERKIKKNVSENGINKDKIAINTISPKFYSKNKKGKSIKPSVVLF